MPGKLALILLALLLFACRDAGDGASATPAPIAQPPAAGPSGDPATAAPLPQGTPGSLAPRPTILPTATSLADGLLIRLATPDPSADCPDHYPWFFVNPAGECAQTLLNTWAVWQPFERGLMVWFQEGGRTYLFIEDGSLFKPYQELFNTGDGSLPGPDPALEPPAGLYQPVLGFARFWRGLAPGHDWVRDRLGWATAPEVGYSSLWQCNTAAGDADRCYFTGPRDEIVAVTGGNAHYWNYWQGPVR